MINESLPCEEVTWSGHCSPYEGVQIRPVWPTTLLGRCISSLIALDRNQVDNSADPMLRFSAHILCKVI